jgi:hypothetical protein
MVWQVREDFPNCAYAHIGGGVAHAITSRLETPAKWCTAACGRSGFAEDAEDDAIVCMRCAAALNQPGPVEPDTRKEPTDA